jgi:hypothetical protein
MAIATTTINSIKENPALRLLIQILRKISALPVPAVRDKFILSAASHWRFCSTPAPFASLAAFAWRLAEF